MIRFAVTLINRNKARLSLQQWHKLLKQAKNGEPEEAIKELHKIIDISIRGEKK